ncbi:MAG: hydrogenase subunit MbhD domain-containing protein [Tepidisphaeraceae bacterium]
MMVLQLTALLWVAAGGTAVVFTRDASLQAIGISFYGLLLSVLFFVFQAPDVAVSQIVVGAVGLPLMILITQARFRRMRS